MRWMKRDPARNGKGRQGAKAAPRRRRAAPRWVRPAVRAGLVASIAGVALGAPYWMWQSGWAGAIAATGWQATMERTAAMGLTVQEVFLEGRLHTPRADVLKAVALQRGDPILGFDPGDMRARLVALPWVREARVERRLPDAVRIRIEERRPLALWQRDGRLTLVDRDGEVIPGADLARFRELPIIVGPDAPQHAATLIAMLSAEPELARRVEAAVRVGGRRWNVRLAGGIEIQLPENEPHEAWRRLARLDTSHGLLARDLRVIDMRLPDRLIVRTGGTGNTGGEPRADRGRNT